MQKETNIITISQLSLSTFLKPILILSQGDLFLYGTETMICHLKRQGWRSGFGTARGCDVNGLLNL